MNQEGYRGRVDCGRDVLGTLEEGEVECEVEGGEEECRERTEQDQGPPLGKKLRQLWHLVWEEKEKRKKEEVWVWRGEDEECVYVCVERGGVAGTLSEVTVTRGPKRGSATRTRQDWARGAGMMDLSSHFRPSAMREGTSQHVSTCIFETCIFETCICGYL